MRAPGRQDTSPAERAISWRTAHSHLFAGAVCFGAGVATAARVALELTFGDGTVLFGTLEIAPDGSLRLAVPAYRTGRGTGIGAKSWLVARDGPERWRIARRIG